VDRRYLECGRSHEVNNRPSARRSAFTSLVVKEAAGPGFLKGNYVTIAPTCVYHFQSEVITSEAKESSGALVTEYITVTLSLCSD
jgi:hypothetical protein